MHQSSQTINPREELARLRKAERLADLFIAHRMPAADLDLMSDKDWIVLAGAVGCRKPSPATKRLVVERVRKAESTIRHAARRRVARDPLGKGGSK